PSATRNDTSASSTRPSGRTWLRCATSTWPTVAQSPASQRTSQRIFRPHPVRPLPVRPPPARTAARPHGGPPVRPHSRAASAWVPAPAAYGGHAWAAAAAVRSAPLAQSVPAGRRPDDHEGPADHGLHRDRALVAVLHVEPRVGGVRPVVSHHPEAAGR